MIRRAALGLAVALLSPAAAWGQDLTVVNLAGVKAKPLAAIEKAVTWEAGRLRHYWKTPSVAFVQQGGWPIFIVPSSAQVPFGYDGWHFEDHGEPFAVVSKADGLSDNFSHEVMEMLADPQASSFVSIDGHVTLREVCDPVEDDYFDAPNNVEVADFITPAWYGHGKGPYDEDGYLTRPGEVQGQLEYIGGS